MVYAYALVRLDIGASIGVDIVLKSVIEKWFNGIKSYIVFSYIQDLYEPENIHNYGYSNYGHMGIPRVFNFFCNYEKNHLLYTYYVKVIHYQ